MMVSHYDPAAEPMIWVMPDAWGEECRRLLPREKAPGTPGQPAVPLRRVLDGVLYVLRTGCQWKAVPRVFSSGSTCHRRFQQWAQDGTWERLWREQLVWYDVEHGIGWEWQAADSATVPSPLGGAATGPNPSRRGKRGTNGHGLSDQRGVRLGVVVSTANRTDMKMAGATLDSLIVPRPRPTRRHPQHLCRDKGFNYPETRQAAEARGYAVPTLHKRRRGSHPRRPRQRRPASRPAAGLLSARTVGITGSASSPFAMRKRRQTISR
jgi:putative transposase